MSDGNEEGKPLCGKQQAEIKASIPTKRWVCFWITIALVEFISWSRTCLLLAKLILLNERSGNISQTSATLNTTLTSSIIVGQPLSSVSAYESNQTLDSYTRFSSIIYLILSLLHWIEYGLLAYGSYKFLKARCEWEQEFRKKLWQKVLEHIKQHIYVLLLQQQRYSFSLQQYLWLHPY